MDRLLLNSFVLYPRPLCWFVYVMLKLVISAVLWIPDLNRCFDDIGFVLNLEIDCVGTCIDEFEG